MQVQMINSLRERRMKFMELADWARAFESGDRQLLTRIDGGRVLAEVATPSPRIAVDVGLQIYVDMSPAEAIKFSEDELNRLQEASESLEQSLAQQQANDLAVAKAKDLLARKKQ